MLFNYLQGTAARALPLLRLHGPDGEGLPRHQLRHATAEKHRSAIGVVTFPGNRSGRKIWGLRRFYEEEKYPCYNLDFRAGLRN